MNEVAEPGVASSVSVPTRARRTCSNPRWLLLVIFLVAATVRVLVAGRTGLWPDEIFSLAIATGHSLEHPAATADVNLGDFAEPDHPVQAEEFRRYLRHDNPPENPARVMRAALLSDTSPPLYYLFLYGWTLLFGASDVALRLFSTACALACLPLLIAIARLIGNRSAAIYTCLLFTFSPLAIYYSTEGRMYSLLWLCVLGTTWASLVLQQRGGTVVTYATWVVASASGFLTHYFFIFPWLAIVLYLLIKPGKVGRHYLAFCLLAVLGLIVPWYINLPRSLAAWRITQDWLKWRPSGFRHLTALRDIVFQFFSGHENHLWMGRRRSSIVALGLFVVIAAVTLWKVRLRVFERGRFLLILVFVAACAGPLLFDFVQHTYTSAVPRYAIAALPAAYLLAGYAVSCLGGRKGLVMLGCVLVSWSPNLFSLYQNRLPWAPLREIARSASTNGSPSDLILVHSIPSGVLGIARYVDGPALLASWVGQLGNRRMPGSLEQLAAGRKRVLFIKVHEVGEPAPEEEWLRANAVVFSEARLGFALITDFRPRESTTF